MRGRESDLVDELVERFDESCGQNDDCFESTAEAYAPDYDID